LLTCCFFCVALVFMFIVGFELFGGGIVCKCWFIFSSFEVCLYESAYVLVMVAICAMVGCL